MNISKLWSPFFIVMMCTLLPGSCLKKTLGRKEDLAIKREKECVSFLSPFDLYNNTKRKRALQVDETDTEMECLQRSGNRSPDEIVKCPETFCQHISYMCNIQCREQDAGDVDCELYNCTGTHHCSSAKGLTIPIEEVCDNIDQCPGSDDESTCVRPCLPFCMCIGLMVNYRDTNLDISGFHFNNMVIVTNQNYSQSVSVFNTSYLSYLVITGIHTFPKRFVREFYNLKSLDVSNNKVTSLSNSDFKDVYSLSSLNLSANMINHLSNNVFDGLSHLNELDLSHNQIKQLPDDIFSGLFSLKILDLSSNQIIALPDNAFSGLSHLIDLDLSHNQIAVLSDNVFSGLSHLIDLDLSHNQIKTLTGDIFSGLISLKILDLSNNQIIALPDNVFSRLSHLIDLDLGSNQIAVLSDNVFSGLISLKILDLSNNQIIALPDNTFSGLSHLIDLDLSHNQIAVLSDNVFSGLSHLIDLDLSHNQIKTLTGDIFSGLISLKILDLSNNQIIALPDNVFSRLSHLIDLDLGSNQIAVLSDNVFSGLISLKILDLSSNQIIVLPDNVFSGLSHLIDLDLGSNQIAVLSDNVFSGLSHLIDLDLSHNQIKNLPDDIFSGLISLKILDLSNNQIIALPDNVFSRLSHLIDLDLGNNQIAVLSDNVFYHLSALEYLTLGRNQIEHLPANVFSRLSALNVLVLYENKIASLPENVFHGLFELNELYLEQNHIVALPDRVFNGLPVIFVIRLNGNRLLTLPSVPVSLEVLDISYNSFVNLHFGSFINYSNISLLSVVGNDLEVRKSMFEGLDNLKTLLTDTPFMCCVRPKSVSKDRCIKTTASDLTMLDYCFSRYKSCKSESDAISSCEALIGSPIQRVCLWIIGICALVGNIIVFFYRLFIERGNLTQSYSLFVLNLCISDFLMGVYLLIIGVADVYYSGVYAWNDRIWRESILCIAAGTLSTISSEMSTFLTLLVTIDRVIVIAFPMSRLSRRSISWKHAIVISIGLWVVSIYLAIIPIVAMPSYFKGEYYSQSGVCLALPLTGDKRPGAEYSFALFVCLNCIIFFVIVIGQICIFKSIITSGSRMTSSQTRQRDMSVARTLFMVVATDFCCWFPIGVMGVLSKSGYNIPDDAYAWVMVFVLPVNAAINPFLYTATAIWRKRQREQRRVEMTSTKQSHHQQADSIETSIQ